MKTLSRAIELEAKDDIVDAAEAYERLLAQGDAPAEAYVNAAFLYWQATELGFSATKHLDEKFVERAGIRYEQILEEASCRFPEDPEVAFWRRYLAYVSLGEPEFESDCKLITEKGTTLVPYFYLFAASDGRKHAEEAANLLQCCASTPTYKNRYILSVIRGVQDHMERES